MEKAYVPRAGDNLTVVDYVRRYGPKHDVNGPRQRPLAECQVCKTPMHTINENVPARVEVWAHNPSTKWCPLKDAAKVPYELLSPTTPDLAAGKQLRTNFLLHWELHWSLVRGLVPRCDILQFVEFVKQADKQGFWNHRNLKEWNLPYIFLSLYEFPPPRQVKAKLGQPTWIRCYFDARIRGYRDLWIEADGAWRFFVAHYHAPARNASPGPKHLISDDPVTVDPDFLAKPASPPHPFASGTMRKEFPGEVP